MGSEMCIRDSLDTDALSAMSVGSSEIQDISGNISLHGITQEIEAQVIVARTTANSLVVSTIQPVLVDSNDFEFSSGIQILREAANIASIGEVVPVYFRLSYVANSDVDTTPVALAPAPAAPSNLNAVVNDASTNAALNLSLIHI